MTSKSDTIHFGSVCSGMECASLASKDLGWSPAWFSEIDAFPSAVLAHHFPDVPNLGDMTTIAERIRSGEVEAPELLVGGTPCVGVSLSGLRKSLDPVNPPDGRKFPKSGTIRGPKRSCAWRLLNSEYFGSAQSRPRIYFVASAREGFDPRKVLFEPEGVRGNYSPMRKKGKAPASATSARLGIDDQDERSEHLVILDDQGGQVTRVRKGIGETLTSLTAPVPFVAEKSVETFNIQPIDSNMKAAARQIEQTPTLTTLDPNPNKNQGGVCIVELNGVNSRLRVRKLTPVECERLQGMPDDWTKIPYLGKSIDQCPDSPRYKAIGNAWQVDTVRWLFERLTAELKK